MSLRWIPNQRKQALLAAAQRVELETKEKGVAT